MGLPRKFSNILIFSFWACKIKARGHYATLLQQLHFNFFPDDYLVPIELILCIMEKMVLSPIWCDCIRDKMSIKEGAECSCSNKVALKITVVQSLNLESWPVQLVGVTTGGGRSDSEGHI